MFILYTWTIHTCDFIRAARSGGKILFACLESTSQEFFVLAKRHKLTNSWKRQQCAKISVQDRDHLKNGTENNNNVKHFCSCPLNFKWILKDVDLNMIAWLVKTTLLEDGANRGGIHAALTNAFAHDDGAYYSAINRYGNRHVDRLLLRCW